MDDYKDEKILSITPLQIKRFICDNKKYILKEPVCPECEKRYKPSGRVYKCSRCGFLYDRDGVGAINIYFEKVSSHNRLDVVGGLTPPGGWQYRPQLLCLVGSIRTRRTPRHPLS